MVELLKKGTRVLPALVTGQGFVQLAVGSPIPALTIQSSISFPDMINAGSPILSNSITVT